MGVETNGVPPEKIDALTETRSPESPMAVAQSLSTEGSLVRSSSGLITVTATQSSEATTIPADTAKSSSLSNLHARLAQDDLSCIAIKSDTSIRDEAREPARVTTPPLFSTSGDNYLINATNRRYATSPPPPASAGARLSLSTKGSAEQRDSSFADATTSSSVAKHFRFSGDFTTYRSSSVLSAFASSMGNLSDAWDDTSDSVVNKPRPSVSQYCNASPKSPCSAASVLPELPTRFSFESSSTTSSSSSHLSLLQKPTAPRNQRSFDRKDLLPLTTFQSQCEDFESYISTQINRYGSVEKLMSYAGPEMESRSKGTAPDVSSLSLSPINRRRDDLGPSISL